MVEFGTRFRALETFECPEMRSTYVKNLEYTVRTVELACLLDLWLAEGRVVIVDDSRKIGGHGKVV